MFLMNLLYKKFCDYLNTENCPNQMICVRKEDIFDIKMIYLNNYKLSRVNFTSSTIDLSKIQLLGKLYLRFFIIIHY